VCFVVGFDIAEGFVYVFAYFFGGEIVCAWDTRDFPGVVDADI
jgi:hypothetical protein